MPPSHHIVHVFYCKNDYLTLPVDSLMINSGCNTILISRSQRNILLETATFNKALNKVKRETALSFYFLGNFVFGFSHVLL